MATPEPPSQTAATPSGAFDGPFASLDELRAAHSRLMETADSDNLSETQREEVRKFLVRGEATGAVLDLSDERQVAQAILNYWTATLYTQTRREKATEGAKQAPRAAPVNVPNALLADFDAESVQQAAAQAEAELAKWPPEDQEMARRVLLRLVRLVPEMRGFERISVPRTELQALSGDPRRVSRILEELVKSGVLLVEAGAKTYTLRYQALTRIWDSFRAWLEQRLRFYDAVRYWEQQRRDDAALIRGRPLETAQGYHDLSPSEREFISASRGSERIRTRRRTRALAVSTVLFLALGLVAVFGWIRAEHERKASELSRALAEAKQKEAEDALKAAMRTSEYALSGDSEKLVSDPYIQSAAKQDPIFERNITNLASRLGGKAEVLRRLGRLGLSERQIRVIATFSLRWHGANREQEAAAIDAIRGIGADVLAIQEVSSSEAADRLALELPEFHVIVNESDQNLPPAARVQRMALLLRKDRVAPIGDPETVEGPFARPPLTQWVEFGEERERILLAVVHLRAPLRPENRRQHRLEVEALSDWIEGQSERPSIIVFGMFNMDLGSGEWDPLWSVGALAPTRSLPPDANTYIGSMANRSPRVLSHFLLFGPVTDTYIPDSCYIYDLPKLLNLSPDAVRETISDHNPIAIVLEAKPPPPRSMKY